MTRRLPIVLFLVSLAGIVPATAQQVTVVRAARMVDVTRGELVARFLAGVTGAIAFIAAASLATTIAQAHPARVLGLVLFAVTTTTDAEVEWITETIGRVFPQEWEAFATASGRAPGQRLPQRSRAAGR